jgi:argininosuccinate lyase
MRAAEGGTTLTELADDLVRRHGIPFASAHAIAARLSDRTTGDPRDLEEALRRASAEVLGAALPCAGDDLVRVLSARHFVNVRRTDGGPAPERTTAALETSRLTLDQDRAWLTDTRGRLDAARARLDARSVAL